MIMDKAKIKEVFYSFERKMIFVKFKDGSGYGESGKGAAKTLQKLQNNKVPVFAAPNRNFLSNKKCNEKG